MDAYDRKARLYPAMIVALPLSVLTVLLVGTTQWYGAITTLLATCGAHILVIQIVRDRGVAAQERLWDEWGGPPTTKALRWSSAINPLMHAHRHESIAKATGKPLPTADEEAADPTAADQRYEIVVAILRQMTRSDDHPRVRNEVANYGFRRNLYACRSIAIRSNIVLLIGEVTVVFLVFAGTTATTLGAAIALAVLVNAVLTICWATVVTPEFVRRDADRYAEALIESAPSITQP